MATPHVASAVALMVSSSPGLSHDDLKQILMDTAVDLGAPGMDNEYGKGRVDAFEAVSNTATPDGRIRIKESSVSSAGLLHLTVTDADLRGAGTILVEALSTTEPSPETATLVETAAGSGVFKGTALTDGGPVAADGKVQARNGDLVTVRYVDANDGHGGTNVVKTVEIMASAAQEIRSDPGATWVQAYGRVQRYARYCNYGTISQAVNDSLLNTTTHVTPTGAMKTVPRYEIAMRGFSLVEVLVALLGLGAASVVVQWLARLT